MFRVFITYNQPEKMMNKNLKNSLMDYCNDSPRVNYSYIKELLINYIEPKNLKDESLIISELTNKLITIRNLVKNHDYTQAKVKFEELQNKLNSL